MIMYDGLTEISTMFIFEQEQSVNKVENVALDGTYYLQIIGDPAVTYNITAWVTLAGKTALQTAEALGNTISATNSSGTYRGRITSLQFEWVGMDYYKATIVLAKEG